MQQISRYLNIFVLFFLLTGCAKTGSFPQSKHGTPTNAAPAIDHWPIFRGNPQLSGTSTREIPDHIVPAWTFATKDKIKSSPVIYGSTVYIGSNDSFVYALDLTTGSLRWKFPTADAVEAPPAYADGFILAGSTDGTLYALEAQTGKLKWSFRTDEPLMGSANILQRNGQPCVILGSYDGLLYCLDLYSGKVNWKFETDNYINGTPAIWENYVVFGGCDSQFHMVSAVRGDTIQTIPLGSYVAGSAAIDGHVAVVGNYAGVLSCIDLKQRRQTWSFALDGSAIFSSPAIRSDTVIFGARDNYIYCLDKSTGRLRWKAATRGQVDSSPVLTPSHVLAASGDGWLYCLSPETGKERWTYEIGAKLTGSPAFSQNHIIIGAEDGLVYAFRAGADERGKE